MNRPHRHWITRIAVLQLVVASMILVLLGRLWQLQIAQDARDLERRSGAAERSVPLPTVRGRILADDGGPLIGDTRALVVTADRDVLRRLDETTNARVFARLAAALETTPQDLRDRIRPCGQGGPDGNGCWNGSPYAPVPIATDITPSTALAIAERPEAFPGIDVENRPVRETHAARGVNAAHVLGYVGPGRTSDVTGLAGLERAYDRELRGERGHRTVRVDAAGRTLRVVQAQRSEVGHDVITSLDAGLQRTVERQLHKAMLRARSQLDPVTGRRYAGDSGAAVVLDARTGRVKAMASAPGYSLGAWRNGLNRRERNALFDDRAVLLNRAVQGEYAPGSTFKVVPSAAAFALGIPADTVLPCPSSVRIGGRAYKNFRSRGYPPMDFQRALAVSCDTFYYRLAVDLWKDGRIDSITDMASAFGFGRPTGIDLPGESDGHLGRRPQRAGLAALLAIGQAETTVTPLQLAVAYAAIANGGRVFEPRIARAIVDSEGRTLRRVDPRVRGRLPLNEDQIRVLRDALRRTTANGTASGVFAGFDQGTDPVAAKTGTAEVDGHQTTSWFASFDSRHVVVMMVGQGGTGAGTSGRSVREVWEQLR